MKDKKKTGKPKVPQVVKEAEKTVCVNPQYEGLTIADATRRILLGGKVKDT